ncbi:MAG: prepilin-type N-terminal cleavage/methylation domain-containing protein [Campylobacterota bacterium]|nr:prepilin-type N-terminal cleavage/methylation domain-containing protein [Campylobacterota bacterium]
MKKFGYKKAFSMLELVIVMVVLGIVSSMGATIITQVYQSYIMQRAMYNTTTSTELASSIIYNRLSHRIARTTVGRSLDGVSTEFVNDITNSNTYQVLEWYGNAVDSFNANTSSGIPAWSGFCDINAPATNGGNIVTPASDLNLLKTIIPNLSTTTTVDNMAIIFSSKDFSSTQQYDYRCMGYSNTNCIATINDVDGANNIIILDNNYTMRIHEQYKLTRSAYALVPVRQRDRDGDGDNDIFDLELRYDYQPWEGESFTDSATPSKTLIENVSVFRFSGQGDTLRFKICVDEQIGGDSTDAGDGEYVSICKEKAVIR